MFSNVECKNAAGIGIHLQAVYNKTYVTISVYLNQVEVCENDASLLCNSSFRAWNLSRK